MENLSERKREILDIIAANGEAAVSDISKRLNVSTVTVRNELTALEDGGYIVRTRGGALPVFHQSILNRQRHRRAEKDRIARAAAELIEDGDAVMIEAGTTTALVARYLLGRRDVHLVTNSALVLRYARINPSMHCTVIGGEFRPMTESFVGPIALQELEQFHVRFAFIGTDGYSVRTGLTTHLVEGAEIVRAMARRAEQTVLVADSSKYGRTGFARVIELKDVHRLYTDSELGDAAIEQIKETGVRVTVA